MRPKHVFSLFVPFLGVLVAIAACAPAAPPAAQVAFTSHADGATIVGSRAVVVEADLTNAHPDAEIIVDSNATSTVGLRNGEVLELTLTLKDQANLVTVTVANPGQAVPAVATIELNYPFLTLENNQPATTVIGQPDFDTDTEAATDRYLGSPYLRPLVVNGVLYIPDYDEGRVMGYLQVPNSNGAAADFVLGKQDFDDGDSTMGSATFGGPQTVETDGERLYVLDYSFSRILVFSSLPTTSGAGADHVIGQSDFVTDTSGTSSTRFSSPEGMTIVGSKLIVADSSNHRLLIWNSVPTEIDTPADLVLGQVSMDAGLSNGGGTMAANTFHYPSDVWSDGTRLVVADQGNNRVLIWNSFPTVNNAPADVVLGQSDFVGEMSDLGASRMDTPYSVFSNGNQLFVADANNNRVLVWNSFPTANGQAADVVLGQVDFDSELDALGATGMDYPAGVYLTGNSLFVADNDNSRYLIFEGANP